MTTYMARVMDCDHEGCDARVMAMGTLMDLRADAIKAGWHVGAQADLCPTHKPQAEVRRTRGATEIHDWAKRTSVDEAGSR